MKVPLKWVKDGIYLHARIMATHVTGQLRFLIDTGSEVSFVGGIDARRLGIKLNKTSNPEDCVYLGRTRFRLIDMRNVRLSFIGEENGQEKIKAINVPELKVTPDVLQDKGIKDSPNILGLDFLVLNKLRIVVDGSNNTAWFETPLFSKTPER